MLTYFTPKLTDLCKTMTLKIGPYVVDENTGRVHKSDKTMKWGSKATHLFTLLLKHSPNTISKDQLLEEVWSGRVVTENTLYKTISTLRKELNREGIEIESKFGEGYRLIQQSSNDVITAKHSLNHKTVYLSIGMVLMIGITYLLVTWNHQKTLLEDMLTLDKHLAITKQAFISQINRRNELGELLSQRFELDPNDSWENRFYQLYDQMNQEERFLCQQTRAYTEGPIRQTNQAILDILHNDSNIVTALPLAQELISHLSIWLNKYEKVFKNAEKMCLLYVGVEDGAKYPTGFDQQVKDWLAENQ